MKFGAKRDRLGRGATLGAPPHAQSVIIANSKNYMRGSVGAIRALAAFYKVEPSRITVLHNELDIAFSTIRAKLAGGDNGHNGLKSLTSSFGTANYYRVRLGIGRSIRQQDLADFVLKQFSVVAKKDLSDSLVRGAEAVGSLITKGLGVTQ